MSGADLTGIAAVTALVAGGICVALILILHFVEPEYDPSWRMISEYSLGRHGWIMRVAFIAMAISPAAICVALWPFGGVWTIGLAVVAVGALGAAFVDADPIMTPRAGATAVGRAHTVLGSVLLVGFPIAALVAGHRGRPVDSGWTLAIASAVPWARLRVVPPRLGVSARAGRLAGGPRRLARPSLPVAYLAWVVLAAAIVLSRVSRTRSRPRCGSPDVRRAPARGPALFVCVRIYACSAPTFGCRCLAPLPRAARGSARRR